MWPWKASLRRYFKKELKEVRHKLGGYLRKSDQVEGTASANGWKGAVRGQDTEITGSQIT